MKLAICTEIDFKPASGDTKSFSLLTNGFKNRDLTAEQLAAEINLGHAYCSQHTPPRRNENFQCSGMLSVDLDQGWTKDDLLAFEYVKKYASIVYTTASHTEAAPRLRVVFELSREITDPIVMSRAYRGLILYFEGDRACGTPCQMFYGSKGSNPVIIGKILPDEELDRLIHLGIDASSGDNSAVNSNDTSVDQASSRSGTPRSAVILDRDKLLQTAGGQYSVIGDIDVKTNIHCPEHADKHASAFVLANKAGVKGVHCRKCRQTFWPEGNTRAKLLDFDFYAFETHIDELEYYDDPGNYLDDEAPQEYWSDSLRAIQRRNERFLGEFPLEDGVIFVRSPKGSGKSVGLKNIVNRCKLKGTSVLLIGHRQLLLGQLAGNLGLHYYRDKIPRTDADDRYDAFRYLAICVDSMPHLLDTMVHRYDVIIIDESEQMLAHLTSQTLRDNRRQCYLKTEFYVRTAKTVIACDADLGSVTYDTIEKMREGLNRTKLYTNAYTPEGYTVDLYASERQLVTEMLNALTAGGLHYIACNSKERAKMFHKMLVAEGVPSESIMLVTSDNSQSKETRHRLSQINEILPSYRALIGSPSLGTGIDITFSQTESLVDTDGKEQLNTVFLKKVDTVFGFFDPMINTHFDMDQQLSRVRHPKAVKVWITPQQFSFECEPAVIMENCVTNGAVTDALTGYDQKGRAVYDTDDKILTLFANVTVLANASKNNLKKHFIDLKRRNGWIVNLVEKDETGFSETKRKTAAAKNDLAKEYVLAICNAAIYSDKDYDVINRKQNPVEAEFHSLQRYRIQRYYGEEVTSDLVELDNKGRYRAQIQMLARLLSSNGAMIDRDYLQGERMSIDRQNNFAKKQLLHALLESTGLIDGQGHFIAYKEICSTDLNQFVECCIANKHSVERLFKIPLRADLLSKPMAQLNQVLKLIALKINQVRKSDGEDGKRMIFYSVDMQLHHQAMEYALRKVKAQIDPFETAMEEETGDLVIRYKKSKKVVRRL